MRFFNFRLSAALMLALALGLGVLAQTKSGGGRGFDPARMDTATSACTDFYQSPWQLAQDDGNPGGVRELGQLQYPQREYRKTLLTILEESPRTRPRRRVERAENRRLIRHLH